MPIRPIVSFKNAPSYKLATMFTSILQSYIPLPNIYNVQNSVQLMRDLSDIPFVPGLKLASLDISDMYTNIPTEDIINIISNLCEVHNLDKTLTKDILTITRLIVTQNYFWFKDNMYIQKKGLAIGAPTSSIFSEIYLQYMENTLIYDVLWETRVEGYFRYVDDILIVCNENLTDINEIHNRFNSISPDLNFTLELEQDDALNFLDLTIKKTATKMIYDIHRKPTTDNIIPNDSCHPSEQKLAAIWYFLNRINTYDLGHAEKQKETEILKQIVYNNKFHTSILSRIRNSKTKPDSENQRKRWTEFTYVGKETRQITKLFKNTNVRIAFTTNNSLGKLLNS